MEMDMTDTKLREGEERGGGERRHERNGRED